MRFKRKSILANISLAVLFFALGGVAPAATIIWTNAAGGNWSAPANWSPNQVPDASDTAIITNTGDYTVTMDVSAAVAGLIVGATSGIGIQTLLVNGQSLTLNGQATVNARGQFDFNGGNLGGSAELAGTMNWAGGALDTGGSLTLAANGVLNLPAGGILFGPLTNNGTVNWKGGTLFVDNYSTEGYAGGIWNLAGAQWSLQCDQNLESQYAPVTFNNAGTLTKSITGGTTTLNVALDNTGTVQVQTGTIQFNGSGNLGATFQAASGAAIDFDGSYTWDGTAVFQGPGAVQITGGSLAVTGASHNPLVASGVVVSGLSNVLGTASLTNCVIYDAETIGGAVNWPGAVIETGGSLRVSASGVLNLPAGGIFFGPLTNNGTVNWQGGTLFVDNYSAEGYAGGIWNQPAAQWNVECDRNLESQYAAAPFYNAGTLAKSVSGGTTTIDAAFNNIGTVEVEDGTVQFYGEFQPNNGELLLGLSGLNNFGSINIGGQASLGGTLGVVLLGGYVPGPNDSFALLGYDSAGGQFATLTLPPIAQWATKYGATSFTVTVASTNWLAFTTPPVSGPMTNVVLAPVVVQEVSFGVPVATAGLPVTVSLITGSGTLNGTLTQATDASGQATFRDLGLSQTGWKTLRATSPPDLPATSAPFKILAKGEQLWTPGGFLLTLYGNNNLGTTTIYASTNLTDWTPIHTNPPTTGNIQILDTGATNYPCRFYRSVEQ